MIRRHRARVWLLYALALLPVWLLDSSVLSRYPVWGVHPTLIPVAVAVAAALKGPRAGAGFGLAAALLWYATGAGVGSGQIFLLTATGLLVGGATQYALSHTLPGCLICAAGALAVQALMRVGTGLFLRRASFQVLAGIAGPEFLLSLAWTPLVYLIFRLVLRGVTPARQD